MTRVKSFWRPIAALALAVAVFVGAWSYVSLTTSNLARTDCAQIELLKTSIRGSLERAQKLLGRPGGSGYQYYRTHPDELMTERHEIAHELRVFQKSSC